MLGQLLDSDCACVPNVNESVFAARHEEVLFAVDTSAFVHAHVLGHKLDVRHEVLVRTFDVGQDHLLEFDRRLLGFVLLLIRHFGSGRLAAACNSVVHRAQIPAHDLPIDGATDYHPRVLRMELDSCNFHWRLQYVV